MDRPRLAVIDDVHGKMDRYAHITRHYERKGIPTLQLGDLGFRKEYAQLKEMDIDPEKHKFFAGNHDDYEHLPQEYCIGDFGNYELGGVEFFFFRGAYSIDRHKRTIGVDWWEDEELSWMQCRQAIDAYAESVPKIVISHDCPRSLYYNMLHVNNFLVSNTDQLLQHCFEIHRPHTWIFGHHHTSIFKHFRGTAFKAIDVLEAVIIQGGREGESLELSWADDQTRKEQADG